MEISIAKIKTSLILIIFLFMFYQQGVAQNVITGRVTDKTTNNVLPAVNVYLLEQNRGTITNERGEFVLSNLAKGKLKIQFSYVGYKTIIKNIIPVKIITELNIKLEPTVIQTKEVVVSGGTYSTQDENAIKIDVIKERDISVTGTPTFTEVIASVPGLDMISKGPGVAKPVIRGLSMTNISMLNNGVKIGNYLFSENHPYTINEFGIDRIEIIKGPASLLYGSDAVGGVINILKEKPAPTGKITGDYGLQYHSNTKGVVSNLGIKGSSEKLFWGFRGGIKSHTDYKDGMGNYVPNTRFNEYSFKANTGINKSFGSFRLYYDYNHSKLGMCVKKAVPLITENGRKNKIWYQDLTYQIISSRNKLFIGSYKIDVNIAYQMNNRTRQTDNSMPAFRMVDMDLNTFSYEVKTYFPSDKNSVYILGIQGINKTNRNRQAPIHVIPDADVNNFSVFGLAQYTFFHKLQTQLGMRYDVNTISTKQETGKAGINRNFNNMSVSIGGTYNLNENILLRANIASAYRTPNIAELTQNGMHVDHYEQGNADLNAQRNYEADLNVNYHSKHVMIDISGFYNKINDYIFVAPTNDTINSGDKIYKDSQVNALLYGGETNIEIIPVNWVNFKTTCSYVIGKKEDNSYLPFIPQSKLRIEAKIKKEKMVFLHNSFLKIGTLIASKQNHPAMFETGTDGYFLLNTGFGTNIKCANQMILISAQVNNLLNKTYIDHLSLLKGMGYYNIGRNISINLKMPFGFK